MIALAVTIITTTVTCGWHLKVDQPNPRVIVLTITNPCYPGKPTVVGKGRLHAIDSPNAGSGMGESSRKFTTQRGY